MNYISHFLHDLSEIDWCSSFKRSCTPSVSLSILYFKQFFSKCSSPIYFFISSINLLFKRSCCLIIRIISLALETVVFCLLWLLASFFFYSTLSCFLLKISYKQIIQVNFKLVCYNLFFAQGTYNESTLITIADNSDVLIYKKADFKV